MWIKNLFRKENSRSLQEVEASVPIEEEEEQDSKIHTVPQEEVDSRYSQLRIIKIKSLKLPQN